MTDFQTRHNREVDVYRAGVSRYALVLGNLCEYRNKSLKLDSLDYISVADSVGLSWTTLT